MNRFNSIMLARRIASSSGPLSLRRSAMVSASTQAARSFSSRPEPAQTDTLMQIGTRSIFDSDHDAFREMARGFFEENVKPFHAQWEKDQMVSREVWTQAGEMGLLCPTMPEEYGGVGCDIKYSAIGWEEQSYSNCTGPGFSLHSEIVAPYILHYGTEEQKQHYLPQLISGECIGSIAMTEPGAGSDLQGMKTYATKDGDDWILNGSKIYITNGYMCDVSIVCAQTNPEAKGAHGISLFLVDSGLEGYSKGKPLNKLGMKAQDTCELFFEDVRLPGSALLGEENKGFMYLMKELPQERLLIADMAVASAEAMFEWTRDFVADRKAFGRTTLDLQTVQHKMAEMKTEICVGRTFADKCIELHAEGRLDTAMASMAKYNLTDLQNKIAYEAVQLHGGAGFMWEYDVCRAYADARVQSIYGGTNEIMKELIARTVKK